MTLAEPAFDRERHAWVLTRYRDVAAALRDPRLVPVAARTSAPAVPLDGAVHSEFRAQALGALSAGALAQWSAQFAAAAVEVASALPTGRPVDLIHEYARPASLRMAAIAAAIGPVEAGPLSTLARSVFDAAGEPYDAALQAAAHRATMELARRFQHAPPWHLQMFVALAHSLPAFLGNAWLVLLQQPAALQALRQDATLLPAAIDELLRLAGPAKAQFRQAIAHVEVGGVAMAQGSQAILRLDLANRDGAVFQNPDELQFTGRAAGHLAFGGGPHVCVGAALTKAAGGLATAALLADDRLRGACRAEPVDGFAVRYLHRLTVGL